MTAGKDFRPVHKLTCDVLVVGAGATGVAAAVTAAEAGLNVVLLERYGFAGGGAVAGLSGTVCGLYLASDTPGKPPEQVVFGFADRFVRSLEDRGGVSPPIQYGLTYTQVHNPFVWRRLADDLLETACVRLIYHSVATGILGDSGRIDGVTAWSKEGPMDIRAKQVIDASGDADLLAMAGLQTRIGDNGRVQNPTMIFRLMNVDVHAFVSAYGPDTIMPAEVSRAIEAAHAKGDYKLPRRKIWMFPTGRTGELLCNCTRVVGKDGRELNTLFRADFTEAETEGRRQAEEYARYFKAMLTGCGESYLDDTAPQVGVRQTRQGIGKSILLNEDILAARKFSDGIARSPWPIELHSGERPKVEWVLDDFYEVPWGCFVPPDVGNLIFAGRCLSAEHEAVASARVTAQCFSYGHAAGHAAILAVRDGVSPQQLDGRQLRGILNTDGARLDS